MEAIREEAQTFTKEAVRERLLSLADADYQKFHGGLLPGIDNILGVRVPDLRKLAKETGKPSFWKMIGNGMKRICSRDWSLPPPKWILKDALALPGNFFPGSTTGRSAMCSAAP